MGRKKDSSVGDDMGKNEAKNKKIGYAELIEKLIQQREKLNELADESFRDLGNINTETVKEEYGKFDVLAEELRIKLAELRDSSTEAEKEDSQQLSQKTSSQANKKGLDKKIDKSLDKSLDKDLDKN